MGWAGWLVALVPLMLAGCSATEPPLAVPGPGLPDAGLVTQQPAASPPIADTAQAVAAPAAEGPAGVRTAPVVPGRRARVFILAAVGDACEPVAMTDLKVTAVPAKGDVTFEPGQATKIATSGNGTCLGTRTTGTGVYYTARPGAVGPDTFAIAATLPTGEIAARSFSVTITP